MKYKDWLNTWLELYVKPVVKIQTYDKYTRNVRVHIAPSLGYYELEQLRAEVLQRFVVNKAETLSPNTVNGLVTVLQKSLNMAVVLGICATQFADKIVRPKAKERKVECFTMAEQKKIEKAVLESKKGKMLGVVLCLYTGLRIGELLALQWSDIDFKKGIVYINKSCHWG
ncbi:MAG: site-specific integrase, partial [Clostridia bacterium]|nr:site-specific integrase [Clostridia bacterium]